jgi:hypothetical protein
MSDDRRAVLEGIAYGGDPRVTPGDRLKALQELRELDGPSELDRSFWDELGAMPQAPPRVLSQCRFHPEPRSRPEDGIAASTLAAAFAGGSTGT